MKSNAKSSEMPLHCSTRPSLTAVLLVVSAPAFGAAGAWKLDFDSRDLPSVTYSENGKQIFVLGCGRAFGLHVKYPGEADKAGKAAITIGDRRKAMSLKGEFEEPSGEDDLTTFVQWDLGFSRQGPDLFGPRWMKLESRLLNLIEKASPLTISSGTASYQLPKIDAAGWRAAIEKCGR